MQSRFNTHFRICLLCLLSIFSSNAFSASADGSRSSGCEVTFIGVPDDFTIQCFESVPGPDVISAIDCKGQMFTPEPQTFEALSCNGTGLVTYVYEVISFGELFEASYTIIIVDDTPISINCPSDVVISDLSSADPALTGFAQGVEECGGATVNYEDQIFSDPARIVRTWTATNSCLESISCEQLIFEASDPDCFLIVDSFPAPTDTVQGLAFGDGSLWQASLTFISRLDLNGTVDYTIPGTDYVGGMAYDEVAERLWLTDRNEYQILALDPVDGSVLQTINLVESGFTEPNTVFLGLAIDNESNLWFSARFNDLGLDSTYQMTTGGVILSRFESYGSTPSGMAFDGSKLWISNNSGLGNGASFIAAVSPSDFSVQEIYPNPGGGFPNGMAFAAGDLFIGENRNDRIYRIGVCSTTAPPVFTDLPDFFTYQCFDEVPDVQELGITAVDPDGTSITYSFELDGEESGVCYREQFYTVIATDEDGESVSGEFVIIVEDTQAPQIIGCPSDIMVSCDMIPDFPELEAIDNCLGEVSVITDEQLMMEGCDQIITRVWGAFDNCGNQDLCVQTITAIDFVPPVLIGVPEDLIIDCGEEIPSFDVSAMDNCDEEVDVNMSSNFIQGCALTGVLTFSFSAVDDCLNEVSDSWVITIVDNTAPVINCPGQSGVEDINIASPSLTGFAQATDECSEELEIGFTDGEISDSPPQFTRTWTATDECGNSSTCTQLIIQSACDPIELIIADDLTINCDDIVPGASYNATGGCPPLTEIVDETLTGCAGGIRNLIRTYTITDAEGNSVSDIQIITIEDQEGPLLEVAPDAMVECGQEFDLVEVIGVSDNCSSDIMVAIDSVFTPSCGNSGDWIITYIATDDCGLITQEEQTISIVDTTAPFLECQNDTIDYDDIVTNASLLAMILENVQEECSAESDITVAGAVEPVIQGADTVAYAINYVLTDECGNSSPECIVDYIVGLDDLSDQGFTFSLYPNPNNGQFSIQWSQKLVIEQLRILDATGRVVEQRSTPKSGIFDFSIVKGVYLLELLDDKRNRSVRRLLVQ